MRHFTPMDGDGPSPVFRHNVTLAIRFGEFNEHDIGYAAAALVQTGDALGGVLVSWTPVLNGEPAKALFSFHSEDDRERFTRSALEVPGVSILSSAGTGS
jgi:hypothetical protein